jgi:hypothetical protein
MVICFLIGLLLDDLFDMIMPPRNPAVVKTMSRIPQKMPADGFDASGGYGIIWV